MRTSELGRTNRSMTALPLGVPTSPLPAGLTTVQTSKENQNISMPVTWTPRHTKFSSNIAVLAAAVMLVGPGVLAGPQAPTKNTVEHVASR
jgi:hypothetical protein